ncbi:hypothetical protein U1839_01150 [Sphingomonas sp. RT2P30]|uniref:hypothetical protein n=1 Tax=Parasphingomonas halimpatiens TaxID=3096162 RepID=UPI002FC74E75
MRILIIGLLVGGAMALEGCVPMMAASAAGAAIRGARGTPASNEGAEPAARAACSARAEQYGVAHVIDVERRSSGKIVVWGTAGEGENRRSFQCAYGSKITSFTLRAITARR